MSRSSNAQIHRTTKNEFQKLTYFSERLRFSRESLGISRYEVERVAQIDEATLRKIEKSDHDHVNSEVILKLYKYFKSFSKFIDPMWLIYGTGLAPTFIENDDIPSYLNNEFKIEKLSENIDYEEQNVIIEILTWQQFYQNSVYLKIFNEFLIPKYKKNDYIGGIFFDKKLLFNMEPTDVILSTDDNSGLSPYYFLKVNENKVILCQFSINDLCVQTKIIPLNQIDKIARIVIHRKTIYKEKK